MAVRPKAKRGTPAPSRPPKQTTSPPSTSSLPTPAVSPKPPAVQPPLPPTKQLAIKQPQPSAKQLAKPSRHPPSNSSPAASHHRRPSSSHSRLKRPPPAAPTDGSPATPVPRKLPLPPDGSVKTCEAVDRYETRCGEVVVGGWKGKVRRRWCQMHEDEEKHVRGSFWSAFTPLLSSSFPLPTSSGGLQAHQPLCFPLLPPRRCRFFPPSIEPFFSPPHPLPNHLLFLLRRARSMGSNC